MAQAYSKSSSHTAEQGPIPAYDVEKQGTPKLPDASQEKQSAFRNLGILDRFLVVWIFLAMAIGIILGNFVPNTGPALQKGKFVGVSVPIGEHHNDISCFYILIVLLLAIGLLVMMYPILCKVRYESLHRVFKTRQLWIQIGFSLVVNWIIAPFFMVSWFLFVCSRQVAHADLFSWR